MQHLQGISAFRQWRASQSAELGFVPTMGALHSGHKSLIKAARQASACVVVSIFVNPLQFDRAEDLEAYPNTLEEDLAICEKLGVDVVFTTSKAEMYPKGFASEVRVSGLDQTLCGATRPGHFAGVTTVVSKLFNIVQPAKAFFGEKDFQQLTIIRRMVGDLNMPLEIVGVPTKRAEDGLALSSRNVNLGKIQRLQAPAIYSALQSAKRSFEDGESDSAALIKEAIAAIEEEIDGAKVDYLEIVDAESLQAVTTVDENSLIAAAVFVGPTRLIDNLRFGD